MIILLIEDVQQKQDKITRFLNSCISELVLLTAKSVQEGLSTLEKFEPELILLDMSLPVFNYSLQELGFKHISYAGKDIIDFLDANDSQIPVIVITAFDRFGTENSGKTLEELDHELKHDYPTLYHGCVYYSSIEDSWQDKLLKLISELK